MLDLGTVRPGSTIRIPFNSFDKDDGSSITMTNYAAADILIYKDGGTTERASTAGFTATTDFDAKTGKHVAVIDLADNTTAGFYSAGSEYLVAIDAVTVDAVTTGGWIARFRIGHAGAWFDTTIATLSTQTSFTLTAGPAEDDALNGMYAIIHDVASAVQCAKVLISDYTGASKTVTLAAGATFTAAATDNISIMDMAPLQPATLGRTLVVDSAGLADANAVKVGPTGSGTAQTAGDIIGDTNDIQTRLPAALVSGRIDASVGAMATNVLTATAINADAITAAKIADGAIDAGAIAAAAITSAKFAAGAVDAAALAADAATEIAAAVWDKDATGHQTQGTFGQAIGDPGADTDTIWGLANTNLNATVSSRASQTSLDTLDDFVDTEVAAIKTKTDQLVFTTANRVDSQVFGIENNAVSAASIAAAALNGKGDWNIGKTGYALSAAGIQAIWDALTTALTTAGSIGKLLVDNINATISSRASQTTLDTLDDYVDTEVAAIKTETDKIAAIKAKTDSLTFTVAGQADANIQSVNDVTVTGNGQSGSEWGP